MVGDDDTETVDGQTFPTSLRLGEFLMDVEEIGDKGTWNAGASEFRGVAGLAWLRFDGGGAPMKSLASHLRPREPRLEHSLEVVSRVVSPQTEASLEQARLVDPEARLGESIRLDLGISRPQLQEILNQRAGVIGWFERPPRRGDVLVEFNHASVRVEDAKLAIGRIVSGTAIYPAAKLVPRVIEREAAGFTLVISSLRLTPDGARGEVTVRLPPTIVATDSCRPATLELGVVRLTPSCELYVDAPDRAYGPWLIGDTGMVVEGRGYVLDLSSWTSPTPYPPLWRGLQLHAGTATGETVVPDPCNTGYLRGLYDLVDAVIVATGLEAQLSLRSSFAFAALNPRGDSLTLDRGWLQVSQSAVTDGGFDAGEIELSRVAVCDRGPGNPVVVSIVALYVQPSLDLAGLVDRGGREISWGELTRPGDEVVAWSVEFEQGYTYLPAGPAPSYCPEAGGTFSGPHLSAAVDASLTELAARQVSGVTFARSGTAYVSSPDRPGGIGNPLRLVYLDGWLRVGSLGVDGELATYHELGGEPLGEPARKGYVGVNPFDSDLFVDDRKAHVARFVCSAVFDSDISGRFRIPPPCNLQPLAFDHMQLTSTAHLVGGDVVLPSAGVSLEYWQLQLVPTGPPGAAGVVSARTGRIVFLAAGVVEPRHFTAPLGLTWGELLATGDLGDLFLDYNHYGQRFDGLSFTPHRFALSRYAAGTPDPYLAVAGPVHFPFFGPSYVNIRDARDPKLAAPHNGRNVTVPKASLFGGGGGTATDLGLHGVWKDIVSADLGRFDCPDATVDYNTSGQDGFAGAGTAAMSFIHSIGLDIRVEIHGDATDIRVSSAVSHDLDPGLLATLSGIAELSGCARITGPLLTRMSFSGVVDHSAAAGAILGPKAGDSVKLELDVTPTTLDFYAAGEMLLSVAGVDLELSASTHLRVDFATGSAEGELVGRIDCDSAIAGLAGEGQVTWHIGPGMHYLQGRMRVAVFSMIDGAGLEGGFFAGHQVPVALAWVLRPADPGFGVSSTVLPPLLTGVFGYGQVSFAVDVFSFGGGVDLYAGIGAFTGGPAPPLIPGPAGLPHVVGACGVALHGEILGGLVSASAWGNLTRRGPAPVSFEGTIELEGCMAWVICASVDVTAGLNSSGFYVF